MKINRRTMLASLAVCSSRVLAEEPVKIDPTLYIPKAHRVEDLKLLHDFRDEYAFVDLVTSVPTVRITHIPVILDRTAGTYGKILGHVSRQSPQSQRFDGRQRGVIVFRGPHGSEQVSHNTQFELAELVRGTNENGVDCGGVC